MIITYILLHEINKAVELSPAIKLFILDSILRQLRGKIILIMIIIISMKRKKGVYHHVEQKPYPPSLIFISYLLILGFFSLR